MRKVFHRQPRPLGKVRAFGIERTPKESSLIASAGQRDRFVGGGGMGRTSACRDHVSISRFRWRASPTRQAPGTLPRRRVSLASIPGAVARTQTHLRFRDPRAAKFNFTTEHSCRQQASTRPYRGYPVVRTFVLSVFSCASVSLCRVSYAPCLS